MPYRIETLNLLIPITVFTAEIPCEQWFLQAGRWRNHCSQGTAEIILLLHFCEVVQCKHTKSYYYIHT